MKNRMESVAFHHRCEVMGPSQSEPPKPSPRTPSKPLPDSLLTPQTQRRGSAVTSPTTPKTGGTKNIWMAPVADMCVPTARGNTADELAYPTPAKEREVGSTHAGNTHAVNVSGDGAVGKLLFPTSSPAKRTWIDGGFINLLIPSNNSNQDNDAPQTPKGQIIDSNSLECPGALLKKRKTCFLPESDEEQLPEVLGDVPKLYDGAASKAATDMNMARVSVKNRATNKGKSSPANSKAKLPLKVSQAVYKPLIITRSHRRQ